MNTESFIRNNKLRRSLFGHHIRQNKFRDVLILMAIISQKQTLANVITVKVVEIILPKIWKFYYAHAPLPISGWLVQQNALLSH